ncbi:hypothetical protein LTR37_015286 [Vermiconidia calcicola]|uniref:Uncharacterized protein n=1 Tax=Vermiconidia calcicola TaxID=1690605 RepID=A0ACC3MSN2_9PEZI|nr:hypothetical protein LTR37_015286 [Vermiconidia calcicola]
MPPQPQEDVRNGRKAKLSPTRDPGLLEPINRFWQKSYAGDYLGIAILAITLILLKAFDEPFHQLFILSDTRIQHPHAENQQVDVFWLCIYALGVPMIVLVLWNLVLKPNWHKLHVSLLGLASSILITEFITDVLKDAIGRPRPDLIARCQPDPSTPKNEFVTIDVCTETRHHLLHDGWRSFPSGHSSFSFSGLGFLALFLAAQLHMFRPRASVFTVLICLVPLMGAALIAISRLEDYRHDVFDVTAGSILGLSVALCNWRRYYPSPLSKYCDEPYDAPSGSRRASSVDGFQRVRDEEEGPEDDLGGGSSHRGTSR